MLQGQDYNKLFQKMEMEVL